MNIFKKLLTKGAVSPLNALGGIVATGFLTISVLSFTGTIQLFDSQVTVTFINYNDDILDIVRVNRGADVEYEGETPIKPSEGANLYVFSGWSKPLVDVRTDLEVKALFATYANAFQATFLNQGQQIYATQVAYGKPLDYAGPTPTFPNDNRFSYEFVGWDIDSDGIVDPLPVSMTANVTARAIFVARLNSFLVTFRNHDRQILSQQTFYYGDQGKYAGRQPFKLPENGQHFVFTEWLPSIDFVMASFDAVAQFDDGGGVPFIAENRNWQIGDTQIPINADEFADLLPYVGEDGNWWLGDFNTELLAEFFEQSTAYPFVNEDGNWQIGNLDTGLPFDLSGLDFPTMGENGNWFIGDVDTNIPAIIPQIGEDGDWMLGDYDTNISSLLEGLEELGTPFVAPNGNWWIGANDTGIPATGFGDFEFDLASFENIPFVGPNDNWWIGTQDTGIAFDETSTDFPYIGANDHWWIGEVDTYISAHEMQGETPYPYIGENGNWWIDVLVGEDLITTDTNISASDYSNFPLSIGLDGNWWLGPTDSGIPAIIISISMDGNWVINAVDTGISLFESGITPPYVGENGNYYIGLVDTGISAFGEVDPEIINPDSGTGDGGTDPDDGDGEEVPVQEQILDTGEYRFGYDFSTEFGGTGGSSGGTGGGGTGGTGGTGSTGQSGICPSDMTVTPIEIEIKDVVKVYDGQSIANDSAIVSYDETILEDGHRIVVTFEDMGPINAQSIMPSDIGQYQLRGKLSIVDENDEILKCVYQPTVEVIGNLVITPRSLIINTQDVQKPADGTPLTNNVYTVTGQGLATGHVLTVVFTGSQTEVGASVNTLDWTKLKIVDAQGVDVTKNYSITYNYGMLVVTFS